VAAAAVYIASLSPDHSGPMLGASGAIQGLAGMYLILFPVHRVYCAMWIRIRWSLFAKVFTLRGFWVLLIYFGYSRRRSHVGRGIVDVPELAPDAPGSIGIAPMPGAPIPPQDRG